MIRGRVSIRCCLFVAVYLLLSICCCLVVAVCSLLSFWLFTRY